MRTFAWRRLLTMRCRWSVRHASMPELICEVSLPEEKAFRTRRCGRLAATVGQSGHQRRRGRSTGKPACSRTSPVALKKAGDGLAALQVRDNGPGPTPLVAQSLFEPFVTGQVGRYRPGTLCRPAGGRASSRLHPLATRKQHNVFHRGIAADRSGKRRRKRREGKVNTATLDAATKLSPSF